jgi:ABC-2 type transport system permease protein
MKNLAIFLYEWKHFTRSPFKIIALLLYLLAGLYALHKGAVLYNKHHAAIKEIEIKAAKERQVNLNRYESDSLVPPDRTWINFSEPSWAIEFIEVYHHKSPSPAMVYSIGQSEQFGISKKITRWASPFDGDLVEEIANPERLQIGTLDFAFVLLFLSPLFLLVLLYNIKSTEIEQGFMALIEVQSVSKNGWLMSRAMFYFLLLLFTNLLLILYGSLQTGVFTSANVAFWQMLLYSIGYSAFWFVLFFFIVKSGKSIISNSLRMIGIYFVFAFIIPAAVYQYLTIQHPVNLMTEFADAKLEKRWQIWDKSDSLKHAELLKLFPLIANSPILNNDDKLSAAIHESTSALENQLTKASIQPIEKENQIKNAFISSTFWFNPVSFFQNRFNAVSQTHYDDYQNYRNEIQRMIDKQIELLVLEMWNDVKVDKKKYEEYEKKLKSLK